MNNTCCTVCNKNNGFYDFCDNGDCKCHKPELDHLAKNELPHKDLDARTDNESARYKMKIGDKLDQPTLIDKIVFPPNLCSRCGSRATFHRRMQQHGNVMNVWENEQKVDGNIVVSIKWDFCLDCHSRFVFEIFIFKK